MSLKDRIENIKIWFMITLNVVIMFTYGVFIYNVDINSEYTIVVKVLSFIGALFVLLIIDYFYAASRLNRMEDYL